MPPGGRGGLVIFMKVIELQMMAMNYLSHPAKDGFFFSPPSSPIQIRMLATGAIPHGHGHNAAAAAATELAEMLLLMFSKSLVRTPSPLLNGIV